MNPLFQNIWFQVAAGVGGFFLIVGVIAVAQADFSSPSEPPDIIATGSPTSTPAPTPTPSPCLIKGNVSFNNGDKIYHVPGSEFYDETVVEPEKGERMFCTEAEAQAAGFRAPKPPPPAYGYGGDDEGPDCSDYETREQAEEDNAECEDLPSEDDQSEEDYDSGYDEY